jgi:hypothetical protein
MPGNNLPYGTPRFEKAFLLKKIDEEKGNITTMKKLDVYEYSGEAKKLYTSVIEQHELNCERLLKELKYL